MHRDVEQRRPNLGLPLSRVDFCREWKRNLDLLWNRCPLKSSRLTGSEKFNLMPKLGGLGRE
jgi:hypothetical protein